MLFKEKSDNFEFKCWFTNTKYLQAMSVTLEDTSVTKILIPLKMATVRTYFLHNNSQEITSTYVCTCKLTYILYTE